MPEEMPARLREAELNIATIGGRVGTLEKAIAGVETIRDGQVETRVKLAALADDVHEAHTEIRAVKALIAEESKARAAGQDERRKNEQTTRTMLKVAAIGLVGTFITSGGAVLVAVLSGGGS